METEGGSTRVSKWNGKYSKRPIKMCTGGGTERKIWRRKGKTRQGVGGRRENQKGKKNGEKKKCGARW